MVRHDVASRASSLALVGGDLALDFANTISGRSDPTPVEHFQRPENIAQWAGHARVVSPEDARWLETHAADERLFKEACGLRERIHDIGAALVAGRPAPRDAIDSLAKTHTKTLAHAVLGPDFAWTWSARETPVEAILGPVCLAALNLLQQGDRSRLKQCYGDRCGWLFLDTTKNRSRRWCEMEVCGNRAKQKRFGDRTRRG